MYSLRLVPLSVPVKENNFFFSPFIFPYSISECSINSNGNISWNRPRRCCPNKQICFLPPISRDRKLYKNRFVRHFFIIFRKHFVLRDRSFTSWTPRNRIFSFINPSMLKTDLQEMPDHIIILIRHGEIGMIPVHEISESLRLLSLDCCKFSYSFLT